jgi:CHASE3 domain sensor protein
MKNKKLKALIQKPLRFHHQDIHEELDELKKQHQVKSKWYYIFWGIMAVAVVGGQIYVGSGYRELASATKTSQISVRCIVE